MIVVVAYSRFRRLPVKRVLMMSAYDGYSAYGRMYGMHAYPTAAATPQSPSINHYHVTAGGAAAGAAVNSGAGAVQVGGSGSAKAAAAAAAAAAYNGLCLGGTAVDLLHPAMHVYPGIQR